MIINGLIAKGLIYSAATVSFRLHVDLNWRRYFTVVTDLADVVILALRKTGTPEGSKCG